MDGIHTTDPVEKRHIFDALQRSQGPGQMQVQGVGGGATSPGHNVGAAAYKHARRMSTLLRQREAEQLQQVQEQQDQEEEQQEQREADAAAAQEAERMRARDHKRAVDRVSLQHELDMARVQKELHEKEQNMRSLQLAEAEHLQREHKVQLGMLRETQLKQLEQLQVDLDHGIDAQRVLQQRRAKQRGAAALVRAQRSTGMAKGEGQQLRLNRQGGGGGAPRPQRAVAAGRALDYFDGDREFRATVSASRRQRVKAGVQERRGRERLQKMKNDGKSQGPQPVPQLSLQDLQDVGGGDVKPSAAGDDAELSATPVWKPKTTTDWYDDD